MTAFSIIAAVTVLTWNGQWFPSGRAEHRASPEAEARTVEAAGKMLGEALAKADPAGTNGVIICLNEIRGPKTAEDLVAKLGVTKLAVAVVTGYRRRDRFDQQQDVIATTLPVAGSGWSRWRNAKAETPPRGYAFADIVIEPAVTARVYAVHLKSNYGQTTETIAARNRAKRTGAVRQLVEQEKPKRGRYRRPVIVAGDFNADASSAPIIYIHAQDGWAEMYEDMHNGDASEPTFHNFRGPEHRGRHIDFIFHRGNVHTLTCDIVKDHEGKMYPSDHYFLDATYAIE